MQPVLQPAGTYIGSIDPILLLSYRSLASLYGFAAATSMAADNKLSLSQADTSSCYWYEERSGVMQNTHQPQKWQRREGVCVCVYAHLGDIMKGK